MNTPLLFEPTPDQTYTIVCRDRHADPAYLLDLSYRQQSEGRTEEACNTRFQAFQMLEDALPEDEDVQLEWNDRTSQAALELVYASAIDNFLVGDSELAAAMLELLLDLDPEDHFGATETVAWCYVQLHDFDALDSVLTDLQDTAATCLLRAWATWTRDAKIDTREAEALRGRHAAYLQEFTATDHPADEEYQHSLDQAHASQRMQARALWLRTEPLWAQHPDFIEALRRL